MKSPKLIFFFVIIAILVVLRFLDFGPMVKLFGNPETYITKGDMYLMSMDYDAALKEYNKAILSDENFPKAYVARGNIYRYLENYEMSKSDYDKAISLDPNCIGALEGLYFIKFHESTLIDYNSKEYNSFKEELNKMEAHIVEVCSKLIEQNPNDPDIYLTRARHYPDNDMFRHKIIDDYNKAVSLAPNAEHIYLSRSNMWNNYKEYDKAISDAKKAIELNPKSLYAYFSWAKAYEEQREYDKAIEVYKNGMTLAEKKGGILSRIAFCYMNKGDNEKALDYYTQAIETDSTNKDYYRGRGSVYQEQEEYDLALNDFNTVLELAPNDKYIGATIQTLKETAARNYVDLQIKHGKISEDIEGVWLADTVSYPTDIFRKDWIEKPISGMPYNVFSPYYSLHGVMIAKDGETYRLKFFSDRFQAIETEKGDYIKQINDKMSQKDGGWYHFTKNEMIASKAGNTLNTTETSMGKRTIGNGPGQDMVVSLTIAYNPEKQILKITNINEKQGNSIVSPNQTNFPDTFSKNFTYNKMTWDEYNELKNNIWKKAIEKVNSGAPLRN
ncbi:MAG: tetratricopeptide repeat protein [Selenomonadaceae bacterium]|nr:tetratricopeptide repeat protein [Selenomonadaceae bacterium]